MIETDTLWIVIVVLGLGSFGLRFMFTGFVGDTAVAILPALVAPQVMWPAATEGETDPARLAAALATLAVGLLTRNVILAILTGGATLYGMLYLLG